MRKRIFAPLLLVAAVAIAYALMRSAPPWSIDGSKASVPVLLSFDVESDEDVEALRTLNITVPASYFITGMFAERHPGLVRELAKKGTIGSHSYSHPNLVKIDREDAFKDLTLAKMILEKVTGEPLRWFRAPYLATNAEIAAKLKELGFVYDSSDHEHRQRDFALKSVPISSNAAGNLASDYELFHVRKLSTDAALDWLRATYRERARTGRPFMILMHPSLTAPHSSAINRFIAFVRDQGGSFVTADDYVKSLAAAAPDR